MINLIEELDLKGIDDTLYEKFYTEKSVVYDDLVNYKGTNISGKVVKSDKDLAILATLVSNKKFNSLINMSDLYIEPKDVVLLYLNIDNEVVLIQTADDFELKNVDQFQDTIYNFRNKIGANAVYLVVYNDKQFNDATVYVSTIFKIITNLIYIDLNSGTYRAYNRHSFTSVDADPPKLHGAGKIKGYKNN